MTLNRVSLFQPEMGTCVSSQSPELDSGEPRILTVPVEPNKLLQEAASRLEPMPELELDQKLGC